jgi:cyclopropane fatty-acyl-phospholipid synthase-like methyltransferase
MFISPASVIDLIPDLSSGITVGDFGCGAGEYSLEVARRMNGEGRVYAIDVQRDLLERIKSQAASEGLQNLITVWSDLEHMGAANIAENSIQVAIIANITFQLEEHDLFAEELKRLLVPGATIIIVDWVDTFNGLGPQPEHLFNLDAAGAWCQAHGFKVLTKMSGENHHYVILGTKSHEKRIFFSINSRRYIWRVSSWGIDSVCDLFWIR